MAHVIRRLHPVTSLPEKEDELSGLYRETLHRKRVLLLMDNAATKGQVEPLMPPEGCALLVTSRFRFSLPGLLLMDLETLPRADGAELLCQIAPRIGEQAVEIAHLCGYLPFALRVAGDRLAERRTLTAAEYAERLRATKQKFPKLDASLQLSYELLTEEQQRLWRQLAVFPGSFDASAASAV